MSIVRVQANTADVERAVAVLKTNARVAIARALNRTADSAKTAVARAIAADLGLKVGVVKDNIVVEKASTYFLTATFRASAKRVPLVDFRARGPEPSRGKGRGVTAKLPSGAGTYPHAFLATMATGHRGVFMRKGPARLPIRELFGPSIWQSFVKNQQVAVSRAEEQLTKNIAHELAFALSRAS